VHTDLDALLTALYVLVDDSLPKRCGAGKPPATTDAEMICLAVAQVLLDHPCDRRFLAVAGYRLGHLFRIDPSTITSACAGRRRRSCARWRWSRWTHPAGETSCGVRGRIAADMTKVGWIKFARVGASAAARNMTSPASPISCGISVPGRACSGTEPARAS
jgi:hypothetical protein